MPRSSAISRRVRPLVSASRTASRRNSGVGLFPFPIEHLLVPQLVLSTFPGQVHGPHVEEAASFMAASVQATTPKSRPTPAVAAMASAPQNVTRTAPLTIPAPPTAAPSPPSTESATRVVTATTRVIWVAGTSAAMMSGMTAPTAKVAADTRAAWIGCAVTVSEMPSSSRECAPSASFLGELDRDLARETHRQAHAPRRFV
jgi:hypothetical protein